MSLIYITGLEGSGKSTLCEALKLRGYNAHDMDKEKIAAIHNNKTGLITDYPKNPADRTAEWRTKNSWQIIASKFAELEKHSKDSTVFICGTAENEKRFLNRFSMVIALVVDDETIMDRLKNRLGTNNYGKNELELKTVINKQKTINEYYKTIGVYTIDASQKIEKIADEIIFLADS